MEDPESTIPWPGFVDILSTVIIVFVFFMMMTSTIIFLMSKKQKEQAVETAMEVGRQEVLAQNTIENLQQVVEENQLLKKQLDDIIKIKTIRSESEQQTVEVKNDTLKVIYNDFGVTLTPTAVNIIKKHIKSRKQAKIQAFIPQSYGAMQEIALNRALNIRNLLIQNGIAAQNINLKIETGIANSGTFGHVLLQF